MASNIVTVCFSTQLGYYICRYSILTFIFSICFIKHLLANFTWTYILSVIINEAGCYLWGESCCQFWVANMTYPKMRQCLYVILVCCVSCCLAIGRYWLHSLYNIMFLIARRVDPLFVKSNVYMGFYIYSVEFHVSH